MIFWIAFIFCLIFAPFANAQHESRECFEGKLYQINANNVISYELKAYDGKFFRLDSGDNFPSDQFEKLPIKEDIKVIGKIVSEYPRVIAVDHIGSSLNFITSKLGILEIKQTEDDDEENSSIYLNDKPVFKTSSRIVFRSLFHLRNEDVVLFSDIGGSGGSGPFQLLTLYPDWSTKISESFGNGLLPEVEVQEDGLVLDFESRPYSVTGETVTYKDGNLKKEKKPY